MLTKSLISAVLLSTALVSSGRQDLRQIQVAPTAPPSDESTMTAVDPGEELREEFHQTYNLSPTGRVSLDYINGGV